MNASILVMRVDRSPRFYRSVRPHSTPASQTRSLSWNAKCHVLDTWTLGVVSPSCRSMSLDITHDNVVYHAC
jgi:hypothetical protein